MAEKILDEKRLLRQQAEIQRLAFSKEDRMRCSAKIMERLRQEPAYRSALSIMLYAPMDMEVQIGGLMEELLAEGRIVLLPLVTGRGAMEAVRLPSVDTLVPDAFDILTVEAAHRKLFLASEIDCVIVSGAAFSRKGARLGLGGGYYDRFLRTKAPQAKRIAVAYSFQMVDDVPTDEYDAWMDVIVTEKEVIRIEDRGAEVPLQSL